MSGGCGSKNDVDNIKTKFPNVSVSMASILHYNKFKIKELR
jgi:imidazole glycerol phosphate synthase subunit HisF